MVALCHFLILNLCLDVFPNLKSEIQIFSKTLSRSKSIQSDPENEISRQVCILFEIMMIFVSEVYSINLPSKINVSTNFGCPYTSQNALEPSYHMHLLQPLRSLNYDNFLQLYTVSFCSISYDSIPSKMATLCHTK